MLVLPGLSWLGLLAIATGAGGGWRSVATGVGLLLCAIGSAGTVKSLEAATDLFRGSSVWRYLTMLVVQLLPFHGLAVGIGSAMTWSWPRVARWLMGSIPMWRLTSMQHEILANAVVGTLTAFATAAPLSVGLWVVAHHNLTKLDLPPRAHT